MTIDKAAAMKQLESLEAEAEKLRAIIDAPEVKGLWKPERGEDYWRIEAEGDVYIGHVTSTGNNCCDGKRINHGSCFPTKEAAKKAAPLFARAHKIIQAALQCDPDAGEPCETRLYSASYIDGRGWFGCRCDSLALCAYVHTEEQAKHMAEILNSEGVK